VEGAAVRRPAAIAASLALALALAIGPALAANAAQTRSYLVVLKGAPSGARPVAFQHRQRYGLALKHVYQSALKGYSASMTAARARALRADAGVAAVVEDRTFHIAAQTLPTGVDRIEGDLSSTRSGNGSGSVNVDVAVIDTGIDRTHPDLNVVGGTSCVGGTAEDRNGHGTHVAGIIAARDDGVGVVGVAPGARLWSVRVLGADGSGSLSNIVCGIDWVTARASTIEVANMSLGAQFPFPDFGCSFAFLDPMHPAICRSVAAGVTYAIAAGNSNANTSGFIPARYPEVIAVSALADFNGRPGGGAASTCRADVDDTRADFSNFGSTVDVIAPGVCILSTYRGGGYQALSGTSMASPHVAGAAALYKASHPTATPAAVRSALQAAGNTNWNSTDDPDGIKERLLDVHTF
jgi:subtilisin family serine protease